jgi:hypothetical protein
VVVLFAAVHICRFLALKGRGDTHQICPLLKVNRPCHPAARTSQFDPELTFPIEIPQCTNLVLAAWTKLEHAILSPIHLGERHVD